MVIMLAEYFEWTEDATSRLHELADEGHQGQVIASILSSEFPHYVSPDAVFHKSMREGIRLRGRSPPLDSTFSLFNPFSEPPWIRKELEKQEEESPPQPPRPFGNFYLPHDPELEPTLYKIMDLWVDKEFMSRWSDYVTQIVNRGDASEGQARLAIEEGPPKWFQRWAAPIVIVWSWMMCDFRLVDVYRKQLVELIDGASKEDKPELNRLLGDRMFVGPEPYSLPTDFPLGRMPEPVAPIIMVAEPLEPEASPEPAKSSQSGVVEDAAGHEALVLPEGVTIVGEAPTYTTRDGSHVALTLRVRGVGRGTMVSGATSKTVRIPKRDLEKWIKEYREKSA